MFRTHTTVLSVIVQYMKDMQLSDWRVIVCEFMKTIAQTSELTAVFPDGVVPENIKMKNKFIRTLFGVLNSRERRSKKGFVFTIDLSAADRFTSEGAKVMAELIGLQAIMMNGNQPNFIAISRDGVEGLI